MSNRKAIVCTTRAGLGLILLLLTISAHKIVAAWTLRPSAAQTTSQWERISTEDEDFSVNMPVRPSFIEKERYVHDGVKVSRALISGVYHNGVVFIARIYEVPELKQLSNERLSGDCRRLAGLRNIEGRDIDKSSFRGKEYLKQSDNHTHIIQCYLTKKRFYVIEAAARNKDNSSIKRFLSSLSLGGGKTAEDPSNDSAHSQTSTPIVTDTSKVYYEKEVTYPAVIINKPIHSYTPIARAARISGSVKLRAVLSASGEVLNIEVLKGLGAGLSESAIESAKKITFLPAEKDGRTVSQYAEVVYHFAIE
ncbi:MAG: vitamin transporter [Pyrinomonadaceae bacterium]|nr:vitamin transporter [Pyrinomonadaceae bacterium]